MMNRWKSFTARQRKLNSRVCAHKKIKSKQTSKKLLRDWLLLLKMRKFRRRGFVIHAWVQWRAILTENRKQRLLQHRREHVIKKTFREWKHSIEESKAIDNEAIFTVHIYRLFTFWAAWKKKLKSALKLKEKLKLA